MCALFHTHSQKLIFRIYYSYSLFTLAPRVLSSLPLPASSPRVLSLSTLPTPSLHRPVSHSFPIHPLHDLFVAHSPRLLFPFIYHACSLSPLSTRPSRCHLPMSLRTAPYHTSFHAYRCWLRTGLCVNLMQGVPRMGSVNRPFSRPIIKIFFNKHTCSFSSNTFSCPHICDCQFTQSVCRTQQMPLIRFRRNSAHT